MPKTMMVAITNSVAVVVATIIIMTVVAIPQAVVSFKTNGLCIAPRWKNNTTTITTSTTKNPTKLPKITTKNKCLLGRKNGTQRLGGGFDSYEGQFPSFAGIIFWGRSYFCSGVLVSDRHILTAGHCAIKGIKEGKYDRVQIRIGLGTLLAPQAWYRENFKWVLAKRSCVSPDFKMIDKDTAMHDFGVLTLEKPIKKFNDTIQPACLPTRRATEADECYSMGIGMTSDRHISERLQVIKVAIKRCDRYDKLGDKSRVCFAHIDENHPMQACPGDSGGPTLCKIKTPKGYSWQVHGLMSYEQDPNIGCTLQKGHHAISFDVQRQLHKVKELIDKCN